MLPSLPHESAPSSARRVADARRLRRLLQDTLAGWEPLQPVAGARQHALRTSFSMPIEPAPLLPGHPLLEVKLTTP